MTDPNTAPNSTDKPKPEKPPEVKKAEKHADPKDKKKWGHTDEKVWESFPASDAPTGWAGKDIPPDENAPLPRFEPDEKS